MKARKTVPGLNKVEKINGKENQENMTKFHLKILDDYNLGIECSCGKQFYPYYSQEGKGIPDKLCWLCADCNTSKALIIKKQ